MQTHQLCTQRLLQQSSQPTLLKDQNSHKGVDSSKIETPKRLQDQLLVNESLFLDHLVLSLLTTYKCITPSSLQPLAKSLSFPILLLVHMVSLGLCLETPCCKENGDKNKRIFEDVVLMLCYLDFLMFTLNVCLCVLIERVVRESTSFKFSRIIV